MFAVKIFFIFLACAFSSQIKRQPNAVLPKSLRSQSVSSIYNVAGMLARFSVVTASLELAPKTAFAKTYFDTDVYGDKELKIATVNKLKQKLRNSILSDISIAPFLLKLSINDALGYDFKTEEGGPDGSIQYEMEIPENEGLQQALNVINSIKKDMLRTNTVSFADVCAFAGAEVLESVGANRVTVQVGRFDAQKANVGASLVPWNNLNNVEDVLKAFSTSGLDSRETVLLLGALGEVERIVKEAAMKPVKSSEDDDDLLDDQPFVPVTFGARDAMYGAKIGNSDFGVGYLNSILKSKGNNIKELDSIGQCILSDPKLKAMAQKYGSNQAAFLKEVPEVYLKLTLLGETYTTRNS